MSKSENKLNWTPSLADAFKEAMNVPTGYDYDRFHKDFGSPDAYKDVDLFFEWLRDAQREYIIYRIENGNDIRITHEEEIDMGKGEEPFYELSYFVDGEFFGLIKETAREMKTLIDDKAASPKPDNRLEPR